MAYITNAVYNKLINSKGTQKVEIPIDLLNEITYYFGVNEVLSQYEFNILAEHINIFSKNNTENNNAPYLPPKEDMFFYVFEKKGAYKYHLFENCTYLNNDFNNYIVPEEIRDKGNQLVDLYRQWFVGNGFDLINGDEREIVSQITFKYNSSFAVQNELPKLNEDYKLIVRLKNSTYKISKKYYNLINVQNNIRSLIKDYKRQFANRTIYNLMSISYYENAPKHIIEQKISELTSDVFIQNYGYDKLMNDFREANRIKYLIMNELKLYINFRCGFKSNDFSKEVLESYGLVCCKSCLERDYNNQKRP